MMIKDQNTPTNTLEELREQILTEFKLVTEKLTKESKS